VSVHNGPCIVTDQVKITILPDPIASLNTEYLYCQGKSRTISAYNPVNTGYLWNTGADSTYIVVNKPGKYNVTCSNVCGTAYAETEVYEEDCSYSIYIPSSFTPNNDGINDYWKPVVYNLSSYEINVFNRWGERIWHSTDPNEVWMGEVLDGQYYTPDGLYTYQLRFNTDRQEAGEERGYIFMLR
jgi:gliding motility-associated-like protein